MCVVENTPKGTSSLYKVVDTSNLIKKISVA